MAKKRRRKNGASPAREWLSDNLRYLLLILIVAIAALVAFLVYRTVSGRGPSTATVTSTSVTTKTASTSVSTEKSDTTKTKETKTEVVTATPTPSETPTPTPTPTPEPTPSVTLKDDTENLQWIVQNYFYTLQLDGENTNIQYYDNIHVQTIPGPEDGTYVAYADYEYKYWDYDTMVPGLTEFYLETDADGNLSAVDTIPADVQDFITDVRQTDAVQSLIMSVQERYQKVLDENPDLSTYVSELQ